VFLLELITDKFVKGRYKFVKGWADAIGF